MTPKRDPRRDPRPGDVVRDNGRSEVVLNVFPTSVYKQPLVEYKEIGHRAWKWLSLSAWREKCVDVEIVKVAE